MAQQMRGTGFIYPGDVHVFSDPVGDELRHNRFALIRDEQGFTVEG
jgi:hypothetical protein